MKNIDGVVNINKEKGFTSHDVVAVVRKIVRDYAKEQGMDSNIKVGHTGTLDPGAEGVLPVCIGKATKISDYIAAGHKIYRAVLQLGITTDTLDKTGTVLTQSEVNVTETEIVRAINSFIGGYRQTPPMFSAIKVDGRKLYELAREGKEIEREKRLITIYDIKILEFINPEQVRIEIHCSKGTYIRSLCDDIGRKLGCGACMDSLLRLRSGRFHVMESIKLDEFRQLVEDGSIRQALCPIDRALHGFQKAYAVDFASKYLRNGNKISINYIKYGKRFFPEETVMLYDDENNLIGLYKVIVEGNDKYLKPVTMLI